MFIRGCPGGRGCCVHSQPAENRGLFNFHPEATAHAQKTDSAWKQKKGRPPWQAADVLEFYCQGGEGCIFSVREDWKLGKLTCCFLCRSTAPGRAGPPWQTAVLEVRCLVQVLFMRRGFEKPPALYKANCVPLSCGMYCPAGTGKVPGHSPPVCVFLSSIQTLSGSLYKKHTEISQIQ